MAINHELIADQVEEQHRAEQAFGAGVQAGRRLAIRENCLEILSCYDNDVERLNLMLAAAVKNCLYGVNGLCWQHCPCRDYCEPHLRGLQTVPDLP